MSERNGYERFWMPSTNVLQAFGHVPHGLLRPTVTRGMETGSAEHRAQRPREHNGHRLEHHGVQTGRSEAITGSQHRDLGVGERPEPLPAVGGIRRPQSNKRK